MSATYKCKSNSVLCIYICQILSYTFHITLSPNEIVDDTVLDVINKNGLCIINKYRIIAHNFEGNNGLSSSV